MREIFRLREQGKLIEPPISAYAQELSSYELPVVEAPGIIVKGQFFHNLDALRGLCAILVALFHATWFSHFRKLAIVYNGWLFVDFFFILSGFVIAFNYALRKHSVATFSAFAVKRFFRLYPLHIATFLLTFVVTMIGEVTRSTLSTGTPSWLAGLNRNSFACIFLVHGLGFSTPSFNAPSWSISAEFWTYLVFGSLALLASSPKRHMLMMACVGTTALIMMFILNYPNGLLTAYEYGFLRCLAGFSIGVAVWYTWAQTTWRPEAAFTSIILFTLSSTLYIVLSWAKHSSFTNCMVLPIFAAIIYFCALDTKSTLTRLLESPLAKRLGRISFSIYMIHTSMLMLTSYIVTKLAPDLKVLSFSIAISNSRLLLGDLFCIVYLISIIITAELTYRLIEDPFRKFGNQLATPQKLKDGVQETESSRRVEIPI